MELIHHLRDGSFIFLLRKNYLSIGKINFVLEAIHYQAIVLAIIASPNDNTQMEVKVCIT